MLNFHVIKAIYTYSVIKALRLSGDYLNLSSQDQISYMEWIR